MVMYKVLFWPRRHIANCKAQVVCSMNGGKTWPYVLKSYTTYEDGYDTFRIAVDSSVHKSKFKLAWIYSGDLTNIIAWCVDDVIIASHMISGFDVASQEISWPPEIITPNARQDVWFIVENIGAASEIFDIKAEAWIGSAHSETIIPRLGWFEKSLIKLKVPVPSEGKYLIKVITSFNNEQDDFPGNDTLTDTLWVIALPPEGIESEPEIFEVKSGFFKLYQNYPNPFRNNTVIGYEIPQNIKVKLSIYDITGRIVRKLIDGEQTQGNYDAVWDGKSDNGMKVSSGIYFCRLETNIAKLIKKIIIVE
jgi:hypothetical protein